MVPFGNYNRIAIRREFTGSSPWRSRPSGRAVPIAISTAVQNRFGYEIRRITRCVFTGNVIPGKTDGVVGRINDLTQIIPGVILIIITTAHILFLIGSYIILFIGIAMTYRQSAEAF